MFVGIKLLATEREKTLDAVAFDDLCLGGVQESKLFYNLLGGESSESFVIDLLLHFLSQLSPDQLKNLIYPEASLSFVQLLLSYNLFD